MTGRARGPFKPLFLAFTAVLLAQAQPDALAENRGFCAGGSPKPAPVPTWGSYCSAGDAGVGRAVTRTLRLPGTFDIYLSGNPNGDGVFLTIENVTDRQHFAIRPDRIPGARWLRFTFDLPASWQGKDLTLVAEDKSAGPMGWFAFSLPMEPQPRAALSETYRVFLKVLLCCALLFLPGFSAGALAINSGVRGLLKLGLAILSGIALPGYLVFFAYTVSATFGRVTAAILPCLFAGYLLFSLGWRRHFLRPLRPFIFPALLTFLATVVILSLGYLFGGSVTPNTTAWSRFSHLLPTDNEIPFLFAEGLEKGAVPKPLLADWLSSDRPPLQTGMVLALRPYVKGRAELGYHVVSCAAQNLWIFALWLLLRALRVSRVSTSATIAAFLLSGFVIVNAFFVWPKLLAGAFMLAFAIPALAARPRRRGGGWFLKTVMAFLLAASLLSHGGTVFALLGSLLFTLVRYKTRMLRGAFALALLTAAFYSPWVLYQKYVDPPGDRLLKYHLAGVEQVTPEPALQTILKAYRAISFQQWLSVKVSNVTQVFGHEAEYLREAPKFLTPQGKTAIRRLEFFYMLPALGFAGFGILFTPLRRSKLPHEMAAARRLLLWALCAAIPWVILLFARNSAIVHVGPYAMVLTATAGSMLAWRAVAPRLAVAVAVFQGIFHWLIYEPDLTHAGLSASLPSSVNWWMMGLHLLSLATVLAMLAVYARPRSTR